MIHLDEIRQLKEKRDKEKRIKAGVNVLHSYEDEISGNDLETWHSIKSICFDFMCGGTGEKLLRHLQQYSKDNWPSTTPEKQAELDASLRHTLERVETDIQDFHLTPIK